MPDKEKVTRALDCLSRNAQDGQCYGCAYFRLFTNSLDTGWCDMMAAITDSLALLKEQEQTIEALKDKLRLLEYGDYDCAQGILMPAT